MNKTLIIMGILLLIMGIIILIFPSIVIGFEQIYDFVVILSILGGIFSIIQGVKE